MSDVSSMFGSMVFDDRVMKERLSEKAYSLIRRTVDGRSPKPIIENREIANEIANAMKDWAIENSATHYTHWFQPLNGVTAEKHESFIEADGRGGAITVFSGKELIKGESDASSFPSGGLRSTFEARGYTAWDPTSFCFIKEKTLCIPTVFCSYGGEALDKKTPLMRSVQALNKQALRLLRHLGDEATSRIIVNAGAEQEYFLIDKELYEKRTDLKFAGRTLIGAKPPKGQELDDHYYGAIKPRVQAFMRELNEELWKLGISAKTEHNEAAPSQHELAPVYSAVNIATDQNQIIMEMMKRVAYRHNFVCILHEKPFEYINGSGKHNNWSICTDTGVNLLDPGMTPGDNLKFLLFLSAVIKGVDEYQDLLRISVATAENDNRLGRTEAPPAIISIFLGDELNEVINAILKGEKSGNKCSQVIETHVHVLPKLPKDSTDRNRTSPFAFTGNKFEFRMPGSSASVADSSMVINTITAEAMCEFADRLDSAEDKNAEINSIISDSLKTHSRIIFSGNGYTDEWVEEAKKRGLCNYPTTADCVVHLTDDKNCRLFEKHGVFTSSELKSRSEILLEDYSKKIKIEAVTMADMVQRELLPAAMEYIGELAQTVRNISYCKSVSSVLNGIYKECDNVSVLLDTLKKSITEFSSVTDTVEKSALARDVLLPQMKQLRAAADRLEEQMPKNRIPYPTYEQLLFSE